MLEIKDADKFVCIVNKYKNLDDNECDIIEQASQNVKPLVDAIIDYRDIIDSLNKQNAKLQEENCKLDKKLHLVYEELCKYDWKNSTSEQIYNQLSFLYKTVFDENNMEV